MNDLSGQDNEGPEFDDPELDIPAFKRPTSKPPEGKAPPGTGPDLARFRVLNHRAALLSLGANAVLTAVKLAIALLTGSIGLLSEAIHSFTDVVSSSVAVVGIRKAEEPADEGHPYGHARIETVVSLAEATLMIVLAGFVLVHAVTRLFEHDQVKDAGLGVLVLAVSGAVSMGVGIYVSAIGKKTGSMALKANGIHLRSDFFTSMAVLLAIAALWLTGQVWLDGAIGIGVSLWLIWIAWGNGYDAVQQLIDRALPPSEIAQIREEIAKAPGVISHHRLRSRQSGAVRLIDVHIVVPNVWTVVQAHQTADRLEKGLEAMFAPAKVVIHVDPYDEGKAVKPPQPG